MRKKTSTRKKTVTPRIKKMIADWKKDGWTSSRISNDDSDFFDGIGASYNHLDVASFTGNDVQYYDSRKLIAWGSSIITLAKYKAIERKRKLADKKRK
ncbi:hypothetical protein [Kordia jejudonensis]|uniref:hypothetical protein n=1 Tax=Kordia jejudonensis TaxID=1348245 RepID=UPI000629B6AC|nr:hypothetical protein [Kordia jejudonensis]